MAGDWFQTYTGRRFYPLAPKPEDLDIRDIAHALARVCRFGGHTMDFYSVAQHSILVSQTVPPELAREGLMHDAAEAYLGDMVRPLKLQMPEYQRAETYLEQVIAERFRLNYIPGSGWGPLVKEADNRLLATERRDLLGHRLAWSPMPQPLEDTIFPWCPEMAEQGFLRRWAELGGKIP